MTRYMIKKSGKMLIVEFLVTRINYSLNFPPVLLCFWKFLLKVVEKKNGDDKNHLRFCLLKLFKLFPGLL